MPKEISRSNRGPHWKTPLCPSWICEQEASHREAILQWGKCPQCWSGFTKDEIDDAYRAHGIDPKTGYKIKAHRSARGQEGG